MRSLPPARPLVLLTSFTLAALASCGDRGDNIVPGAPAADAAPPVLPDAMIEPPVDAAPMPDAANPLLPTTLEETGLYADFATLTLSPDVTEYEPQFELWSDGASKRRWIELPAASQIDSSDMNFWVYPEDTKIWKEFSRGGLRVETRLYWKQGPSALDWKPFVFAWNAAQDEAVSITAAVPDALGTGHDIPSIFRCANCHGPQPDNVLGYSAIQLDGTTGGHNLADLALAGTLTVNPPGAGPNFFPLPGAAVDQAALGYVHGNCGGCHFEGSDVQALVPLELRLMTGEMATVADTGAYQTAVGVVPTLMLNGATSIIEPGDPAASALRIRMNSTGNERMPPVASEEVDVDAVTAIDAWINVVAPP